MFKEGLFDSDGVKLHYIEWGGSGRNLVLLPGLGGTAQIFRGLAPRLTERFRVASLTRRAQGHSERPDAGYDIDTLVDDIRRFYEHLGIEQAIVAGHSWAGIEIPWFATRYPEMVEAVIYLDAVYVLLEPRPDPAADPVLKALEAQPRREDMASRDAYLAFIKRGRPDLASIWCDAIEADRSDYVDSLLRYGPATTVAAAMDAGLGAQRQPDYANVRAPALALVLAGTDHPFLPPDAPDDLRRVARNYYGTQFRPWLERRTKLFREAVPSARIIELPTSNHTMFIAMEDETVSAMLTFAKDVVD
jgi:pimeloyl-ACP methyl ester carboxylesterase